MPLPADGHSALTDTPTLTMESRLIATQDVHALISEPKQLLLCVAESTVDIIKRKDFEMGKYLRLSWWPLTLNPYKQRICLRL